jgi:hypothetical protein
MAQDPRITFKNSLRGYEKDDSYLERRKYHKIEIKRGFEVK